MTKSGIFQPHFGFYSRCERRHPYVKAVTLVHPNGIFGTSCNVFGTFYGTL